MAEFLVTQEEAAAALGRALQKLSINHWVRVNQWTNDEMRKDHPDLLPEGKQIYAATIYEHDSLLANIVFTELCPKDPAMLQHIALHEGAHLWFAELEGLMNTLMSYVPVELQPLLKQLVTDKLEVYADRLALLFYKEGT